MADNQAIDAGSNIPGFNQEGLPDQGGGDAGSTNIIPGFNPEGVPSSTGGGSPSNPGFNPEGVPNITSGGNGGGSDPSGSTGGSGETGHSKPWFNPEGSTVPNNNGVTYDPSAGTTPPAGGNIGATETSGSGGGAPGDQSGFIHPWGQEGVTVSGGDVQGDSGAVQGGGGTGGSDFIHPWA